MFECFDVEEGAIDVSYLVEKISTLSGACALLVHIASDPYSSVTRIDCRYTPLGVGLAFFRCPPLL